MFLLYACSSQYPMLSKQVSTEALTVKEYCTKNGISSEITGKADSLYASAESLNKNGKDEESYFTMELALIHYRLALSKHDVAQTEKVIAKLSSELKNTADELKTYQKILTELESTKNEEND